MNFHREDTLTIATVIMLILLYIGNDTTVIPHDVAKWAMFGAGGLNVVLAFVNRQNARNLRENNSTLREENTVLKGDSGVWTNKKG